MTAPESNPAATAMIDYRVQLDVFHGPLDLLLHLIKRDEIDIHDIPIAHITEQYLNHVHSLERLDINLAGEFVVMASTLMEIKSVMMLPREDLAESDALGSTDDPADPRYELVQQLLAYKRFKDAATALDRRRADFAARFPRRPAAPSVEPVDDTPPELDLEDVSIWDLLEAFNALMEQVGESGALHEVVDDDTPIELHEADIVDRLEREGPTSLQRMFVGRRTVGEMLGLFLALLELLRQRRVRAFQDQLLGEIRLELLSGSDADGGDDDTAATPAAQLDPADPDQFDWPNESVRQRYARRVERRRRGESIREDEELEADLKAIEEQEQASELPAPVVPPATGEPADDRPPPPLESAFDDDLIDDDEDDLDEEDDDEEDSFDVDEDDDEFDEFDDDDDLEVEDDEDVDEDEDEEDLI